MENKSQCWVWIAASTWLLAGCIVPEDSSRAPASSPIPAASGPLVNDHVLTQLGGVVKNLTLLTWPGGAVSKVTTTIAISPKTMDGVNIAFQSVEGSYVLDTSSGVQTKTKVSPKDLVAAALHQVVVSFSSADQLMEVEVIGLDGKRSTFPSPRSGCILDSGDLSPRGKILLLSMICSRTSGDTCCELFSINLTDGKALAHGHGGRQPSFVGEDEVLLGGRGWNQAITKLDLQTNQTAVVVPAFLNLQYNWPEAAGEGRIFFLQQFCPEVRQAVHGLRCEASAGNVSLMERNGNGSYTLILKTDRYGLSEFEVIVDHSRVILSILNERETQEE